MDLSNIIGTGPRPYLEYGWVCAPNTAGQLIAGNTITTLTIDTEIADTGNFGSIASNQITLAAGTYYFEGITPIGMSGGAQTTPLVIFGLYNNSSSSWVSRIQLNGHALHVSTTSTTLKGQFTITSTNSFSLQAAASAAANVGSSYWAMTSLALSTANADQRTTIKLWKLA
jgi:hypothetical protein